jgi:hypothetical protein
MQKTTHRLFSIGFFLTMSLFIRMPVMGILIGTVLSIWAGILPDILDFRTFYKIHRNFLTHSPISPLIVAFLAAYWFLGDVIVGSVYAPAFALLLISTWELHIFMDAFNPSGVPILPTRKYSFRKFTFDDFKMNFVVSTMGIGLIFWGLWMSW